MKHDVYLRVSCSDVTATIYFFAHCPQRKLIYLSGILLLFFFSSAQLFHGGDLRSTCHITVYHVISFNVLDCMPKIIYDINIYI